MKSISTNNLSLASVQSVFIFNYYLITLFKLHCLKINFLVEKNNKIGYILLLTRFRLVVTIKRFFSYYYTLNSLSLFWLAKSIKWIFEISACDIIYLQIIQYSCQALKVTGNHVVYDGGTWFLSQSNHIKFAHFVLLAVSEEAKTWLIFSFESFIVFLGCMWRHHFLKSKLKSHKSYYLHQAWEGVNFYLWTTFPPKKMLCLKTGTF